MIKNQTLKRESSSVCNAKGLINFLIYSARWFSSVVDYNIVCMFMSGKAKPSEEDNNPLNSPAAQSVLGMGYSKVKVQYVIDKFVAEKGRFRLMFTSYLTLILLIWKFGSNFGQHSSLLESSDFKV